MVLHRRFAFLWIKELSRFRLKSTLTYFKMTHPVCITIHSLEPQPPGSLTVTLLYLVLHTTAHRIHKDRSIHVERE